MPEWSISPEFRLDLSVEGGTATATRSGSVFNLTPMQCHVLQGAPAPRELAETILYEVAISTMMRIGVLRPACEVKGPGGDFLLPAIPMFDAPREVAATTRPDSPSAIFIGLPWDFGSDLGGASTGPAEIRQASRILSMPNLVEGWYSYRLDRDFGAMNFSDVGDLNCPMITDHELVASELRRAIRRQDFRSGARLPVFIGGEHGLTFSALKALPSLPTSLVVFDAHDDFSELQALNHGNWLRHVVNEKLVDHILLIGVRGIAPRNRGDELRRAGVSVVTAAQCLGDMKTVEAAIAALPPGSVYISIDIDVLDPAFVPGTPCPRHGGLRSDMLEDALAFIAERNPVCGLDLMEVCTPRNRHDITPVVACELLWFGCHIVSRT
jgi:arginase family enzyme